MVQGVKSAKKSAARGIFVAIGGLFYCIGDNLPPLVEENAEELGCSPSCIEEAQVAGTVMLAIATTTYLQITTNAVFIHNKDGDDKNRENKNGDSKNRDNKKKKR